MTKKDTREIVLSVDHVSKNFHLPHEKSNSIKSTIVNLFKPKDTDVDVQHALKDISFDIKKGEFFGILGRNGSGKSTMLKILAEIYKPTSGTVETKGKLVPFIELGVGFNPELTGRENVYLNGALLGFSRKEIETRYDDIVKFAELEEFMDQKLKNYSSGMQVRLAFSVATRAEADILLVDEVLAVGDADFQRKCYDYFKSLKKSGKTVVFVTHDMSAVREYCDRAILIKDGKVAHEGLSHEIANEYLKLFNPHDKDIIDSDVDNSNKRRWGNGIVKVDSVIADLQDDELTVTMKTKSFNKPIDNIVIGFNVKDNEERLITGFSTKIIDPTINISYAENEKKTLIFKIPNIFGNGSFTINTAVLLGDRVTVCDSWDGAAAFFVTREESYYPVEMNAKLTIK
jgi:ABC-2 type transport system ATP-binding protein